MFERAAQLDYKRVEREGRLLTESELQLLMEYMRLRTKDVSRWDVVELNKMVSLARSLVNGGSALLDASAAINDLLDNIQSDIESAINELHPRYGIKSAKTSLLCPQCLLNNTKAYLHVYAEGDDYYLRCAKGHYDDYYIDVLHDVARDYLQAAIVRKDLLQYIPSTYFAGEEGGALVRVCSVLLKHGLFTHDVMGVYKAWEQLRDALDKVNSLPAEQYTVANVVKILQPPLEVFLQTVHGRGPILEILLGKEGAAMWASKDVQPSKSIVHRALMRALRSLLQR